MLYSRLSLLSVVLLLVTFVNALPIFDDDIHLQARVDPQYSSKPKDWSGWWKLRKALKTEPDQATFWSGRRGGQSTQGVAEHDARRRNGKTLEMALHEGGATMPPWTPGDKKVESKWNQAAKIFAKKAQGDVHAHVGESARHNSVYHQIEKPILQNNRRVNSITEHRHDGTSSVIPGGRRRYK